MQEFPPEPTEIIICAPVVKVCGEAVVAVTVVPEHFAEAILTD
jgi:hypothetical protein